MENFEKESLNLSFSSEEAKMYDGIGPLPRDCVYDSDSSYDSDIVTVDRAKKHFQERKNSFTQCRRKQRNLIIDYHDLHLARQEIRRENLRGDVDCFSRKCNHRENKKGDRKTFRTFPARLTTFDACSWPIAMPQSKIKLASSGFIYFGKSDEVTCFYCGISIKAWQPDATPDEMHKYYNPNCHHLRRIQEDPAQRYL
jgi:Inhibitor of Apoptosis domain